MRQFLAGVLEKLPECMALYAPVINSYKRYVEGTWAPLNTTWGMDNRTCSVRIINVNKGAIRIENRVPGADANFYLVFAATLASGLYGIEHELELPQRLDGNAYDAADGARSVGGRAYPAVSAHAQRSHRPVRAERVGQRVFRGGLCGALCSHQAVGSQRIRESRHQLGSQALSRIDLIPRLY